MGQSLLILIIEDSQDDVILLQHALLRAGYAVTCEVVDTSSAMRAALENHSWDIITSDHSMPQFSAPAALALANEICPEVPFIILSGEIDLNLAVSLMRGGAKDYIQKRELVRLVPAIERELKEAELRRERQRVDAALVKSDERFQEVLENSMDASYKRNILTNTYEYLSPVFGRITGFSPYELNSVPSGSAMDLIHPDDLAEIKRVMDEFIKSKTRIDNQLVYRCKHKKGHYIWLQDKFTVMRDSNDRPVALIGSVSDITERKRMEDALREEDHLLKQMVGFTEELLRTGSDQVTYQKILENLTYLSKAKYGALTLLNESTGKYKTIAVVGINDGLKKVSKILGYDIMGKEWDNYSVDNEQLKGNIVTRFSSLSKIAGVVIPEIITDSIAKLFNMGEVAVTKVFVDHQMIGDFTLIMPAGKHFENDSLVEIYSRQIDMFFTRIKPEKKLKESEEKYRTVADFTFDWETWRAPGGPYRYISPSCERISGHSVSEFMSNPNLEIQITHPDDQSKVREHFQMADDEGQSQGQEIDFRIITPSGETRWISHSCTAIYSEDGKWLGRRASNRDITERKHAEEALRESQELLSLFMHHSPIFTFIKKVTPAESRVLLASDNFNQMIGISGHEMIGKSVPELFPPELAAKITADDWSVVAKGEVLKLNEEFKGRSYTTIKFPIRLGENTLLAGYTIDITESKRANAELEALLEIMQAFVVTKDIQEVLALVHRAVGKVIYTENFFVVFFNKETGLFEEVYSVDKYDLPAPPSRLEKSITAYIYRTGKPQIVTQALFNDLEGQGEVEMVGTNSASWLGAPLITTHGTIGVIVVQDYETPDRYAEADKSFLAYVGSQVALAIERKQAEEQIHRLNSELELRVADRTEQLTAANQELEAFSYSVSHDLRAPLRALEGFSAILMSDYQEQMDEQGQYYLARIREATRRMGQLIEDLLNLSRITHVDFFRQQVDLSALANRVVAELTGQSPQRCVEFEITSQMIVEGDENLLKIVLENLMNNAFKFTSRCNKAFIQVGSSDGSTERVYFVRDNGAGFNMDYAHKLFGPFQRLHHANEYPGIGIGLATVQRIIRRHGGRVWAEGAENEGATFYFTVGI